MSGDAVGVLEKARRFISCLAGADGTAGAHGNGTLPKAPGQLVGVQRFNGSTLSNKNSSTAAVLRHNPIDVTLNSAEPVSVLQGNPGHRIFEASWCGVPVHLHVLTFVKRPNPIAQLPGPSSPHATVAAALDAPPPAQANMLTQPDMIAVATEVEAALVQLIAEPSPQVLPVLACAKITSRAHVGSPGDENVTQRIIAEVHILTPRLPGLVSLSQWLQERWPQCDVPAPAAEAETADRHPPSAAARDVAAPLAPQTGPHHRLAASASTATPAAAALTANPTAVGGSATGIERSQGAGPSLSAGAGAKPGPSAALLGVSQPIAEAVIPRDVGTAQYGAHHPAAAADPALASAVAARAALAHGEWGGGGGGWMPCLASCFAGPAAAVSAASERPGAAATREPPGPPTPTSPRGAAGQGGAPAAPLTTGASAAAAVPAIAGSNSRAGVGGAADAGAGDRRLAGVGAAGPGLGLGLGRGRFPPPPPPPRSPKLPVPEALEVLICLAEALRNLHRRGMTHGSITPKTIQLQLVEPTAAGPGASGRQAAAMHDSSPTPPMPPRSQGDLAATVVVPTGNSSPAGTPVSSRAGTGALPTAPPPSSASAGAAPVADAGVGSPAAAAAPVGEGSGPGAASTGGRRLGTTAAVVTPPSPVDMGVGTPGAGLVRAAAAATAAADSSPARGTKAEGTKAGSTDAVASVGAPAEAFPMTLPPNASPAGHGGGAAAPANSDALPQPPVVPIAPAPSLQLQNSVQHVRRRPLPGRDAPGCIAGGTLRALLSLPAIGPAVLQMKTWGRARPGGLPRDQLVWCAPELLNGGGGISWGLPLLPRRSGSGSATMGGGLGPLDQSIGCRGGNRMRGGGDRHHHSRHFGDGSYGGSVGGVGGSQRRFRNAASLLVGQDPGAATASNANGITPSCDVYSLGMLMWHLVSGQTPFTNLPMQDQVVRAKEIGSLDEQLPFSRELPSSYIQLARRCWAPLPMQRPTLNVVLSEMRSLRAQLLGLTLHRELGTGGGGGGDPDRGFGYGGSSMGEMTADSRLSFTLTLPLSSRDLSNGEEYSLARPPLELAFGAGDTAGGSAAGAGDAASGGGGGPGPPPLKSSLPAALLTALTAPRHASVGGLMDDDDDYSDTDRFTEHDDTGNQTEVSASGTPYSSPTTVGTIGRGGGGGGAAAAGGSNASGGVGARLRAVAATARSFRLLRASHRQGSTAGSTGRSGGSAAAALLAANNSRRGGYSHGPGHWAGGGGSYSGLMMSTQPPTASSGLSVHASISRVPSTTAAVAVATARPAAGDRCASSGSLVGLSSGAAAGMTAPSPPPAAAALRFSLLLVGGGSCCGAPSSADDVDDAGTAAGSGGGGDTTGGNAAGSSGHASGAAPVASSGPVGA